MDSTNELPALERRRAEQAALLDRIVIALEGDGRVEGAWLSGSFGRDEADVWSDFDLHVAVADPAFDEFLAERLLLYQSVGVPILVQEEMPSDDLTLGVA